MSRYVTEAQLDKIIEKATKRTIMAFLSEADKPKSSGKPKAELKTEKLAWKAELFDGLAEHYEDYEGSELAEASRKKFGKANLRCIILTWGILHKQPSVRDFVGNKKSKELRSWYKRQVA
jgi:hypothetical protein